MNALTMNHTMHHLIGALFGAVVLLAAPLAFGEPTDTLDNPGGTGNADLTMIDIDAMASEQGEFDTDLVEPLIELARRHLEAGDFEATEDALRRAQHIIHRNKGVHALEQLEIVELMTELHLRQDDPYDADREQQLAMYLAERNYGKDSVNLVPAMETLAAWYADTGQFHRARRVLERTVEIIETNGGEYDPRLIEPLIESARIRRLHRICCSYKLLEQAQKIVDRNPDLPSDEKAEVYAALGDAYLASGKGDKAAEAYRLGWTTLDANVAETTFSTPAPIALAEDLEEHERSQMKVYKVTQDPLGFGRLQEMSVEERLGVETRPPQQFLMPLNDADRPFLIQDSFTTGDPRDQTRKMVGRPFQFILPQLQQILPLNLQSEEELAALRLDLFFTVNADGSLSDLEVRGDAPAKLKRLMKKVLYKATFRPRLKDGEPVETANYRLTQTFD